MIEEDYPLCKELLRGVAVIIDDKVYNNDDTDYIQDILNQLEKRHIPCIKYPKIPANEEEIENFSEVCFVILDWEFDFPEEISIPYMGEVLEEGLDDLKIQFLKTLFEKCYVPVFIFSNVDKTEIKSVLIENDLYSKNGVNNIFIQSKQDLKEGKLFKILEKWMKEHASVYVLKKWTSMFLKAKTEMFRELYNINPKWPKIFWNASKEDSVNQSFELRELLTKIIYGKLNLLNFNSDILHVDTDEVIGDTSSDFKKIWELSCFVDNTKLPEDSVAPGDLFQWKQGKYCLNIRPECDCTPRNGGSLEKLSLYLITGKEINSKDELESFNPVYGHYEEYTGNTICYSVHGGKIIKFQLNHLDIKTWSEMREKRVGRILPPGIIAIQQKYAAYIQRMGMPRIPAECIPGLTAKVNGDKIEEDEQKSLLFSSSIYKPEYLLWNRDPEFSREIE